MRNVNEWSIKGLLLMSFCCLLLAGCSKGGSDSSTPSPTPFTPVASPAATEQASEGAASPAPGSTDQAINGATVSAAEKHSKTAPAQVQLQYAEAEVPAATNHSFAKSEAEQYNMLERNLLVYTLDSSSEDWFLGLLEGDEHIYSIGAPIAEHYLKELSVSEVEVGDQSLLHVQALCGAHCMSNYFFNIDEAGLSLALELNGGVQIVDLEQDQQLELLVDLGRTSPEQEIYRLCSGQWTKTNLNQAIGNVEAVIYVQEERQFQAFLEDGSAVYRHHPDESSLERVD